MSFEEFQDGHEGRNLGYQTARIFAFLNLYVALMPPILPTFILGQEMSLKEFQDRRHLGY